MEANQEAHASTSSGSRRSSAPMALARSHAWIRWSANSCDTYSRAGVGPLDSSTVRSRAPSACTDATAWAEDSSADAVRSVQADGALERTVDLSSGPTPAAEYVSQLFADHLIHAWDLARAVGADERLDPELVDACAAWFASMEATYRAIGAIGDRPETPPGADAQTRLLAAFGRTA